MFYKILLCLFFVYVCGKGENLDLKIDYYEALIKKGVQDAATYKIRIDNSDFFANVTDSKINDYGDFDFVIVGAGTTGCVLVNRLSEIENWNILVLEAGKEEDDLSQIPGIHTLSSNFFRNWGYISTPQKNGCLGMVNNQCLVTRGLSVGGSSAISGLIYSRGTKYDFDRWASQGNSGWSFDEVLPYFKKAENFRNIVSDDDKGFAGPINVEYSNPSSNLLKAFVNGMKHLGYDKTDYNSATNNIGINRIQYNTNRGERVSGGNSYLKQARNRHNVKVVTGALVSKILIDNANVVRGVRFIKNGEVHKVTAKKEVILSAGAVNTPHLLMLSGIGPKLMLKKHEIKLVENLPVGEVLKDHLGYLSLYIRTNYTQNTPPLRDILNQYFQGQGYLTKSLNSESIGYISTNNHTRNPNIEFIFVPPTGTKIGLYSSRRFNKEMTDSVSRKVNIFTDISIAVTLLHPKSTGRIFLKSNNPEDFPEIDIGIFNEESDVEEIYQGIKIILKLLDTEPFKKLNASIYSVPKPCESYEFNSKSFWYCSIKHISFAAHQMTSTTKMGTRYDSEAVVDRHLKVHGMKRLRIADCGVIPTTLSGQLNAVAYMIGEKASDIIKEEYLDASCIKNQ
ncbi:hypothetical protein WA026_009995 [Henosepilachna vigintioctopunctata]|uniref:Glucose-methanol-choline oxidoreductase N-terminal domain-containing protein n=1 Tax=Henosepilachna vigintioctopunctata TaxID=420089 RepID=A0AAW1TSI6_9CUCU